MADTITWAATPEQVPTLSRRDRGVMAEVLIESLDLNDGDPDLEDDDPDHGIEDLGEAASWLERIDQTRPPYGARGSADARNCEDAEDDGDTRDGSGAEDEELLWRGWLPSGPGCIISDPDAACDDFGIDPEAEDGF
jgi:hypothetical protein